MALQNEQSGNAQICNPESADYQPESSPQKTPDLSPSQTLSICAGVRHPASPIAQGAVSYEIDPCGDTILGYEIVDGRERCIWGWCHNTAL
jgi:hypothetical protein